MSLQIVANTASLVAAKTPNASSALSSSLARLSTGLKINRGAGGPAALVIFQQQAARIASLHTALDTTNKTVTLTQTTQGALIEINSLLQQARGLALDSANANDAASLAANQAQMNDAIEAINVITRQPQIGDSVFSYPTSASLSATGKVIAAYLQNAKDDFTTLSRVDLTTSAGAKAALAALDKTIGDVSQAQSDVYDFQNTTLQANAASLSASLENTTAAKSAVMDTDFTSEIANFARFQPQLPAGATVLGNANQTTQLVATLLGG